MYLSNIIKGNIDRQQNTNTSWLATTIKEIMKTPIKIMDKRIFSFKRTNKAASSNIKILAKFNGNLGPAIAA